MMPTAFESDLDVEICNVASITLAMRVFSDYLQNFVIEFLMSSKVFAKWEWKIINFYASGVNKDKILATLAASGIFSQAVLCFPRMRNESISLTKKFSTNVLTGNYFVAYENPWLAKAV